MALKPNRLFYETWGIYVLFGLNLLLIFCCFFQNSIKISNTFSVLGHLHPAILHLPIGLIFVLVVLYFTKNKIEKNSFDLLFNGLIFIISLFTCITAFAGIFLASEQNAQINSHKYSGLALSVLCFIAYFFKKSIFNSTLYANISLALLTYLTLFTGHLGGSITHGENFLFPNNKVDSKVANTTFGMFVQPIFNTKCASCHNGQKMKGGLNLTSIQTIKKGGKHGALYQANDSTNSLIVKVLSLGLNDKKHMPPKDKPQLTTAELNILKNWLIEGASFETQIDAIPEKSYFFKMKKIQKEKIYNFSSASANTIAKINNPFCNVSALASGSPALKAEFFVSSEYNPKYLDDLGQVKAQLISLSLAKMPVGDEIFSKISLFENLEILKLDQTNITGKGIEQLEKCNNLEILSLTNNKLDKNILKKILQLKSLKELYLWETGINKTDVPKNFPDKFKLDFGYVPNSGELLKLNQPMLANDKTIFGENEFLSLKHTIKNTEIRYLTDTTSLDSSKGTIYNKPILITGYTKLKTIATKAAWLASNVKTFTFFKSTIKPISAELLSKADPKYPGTGAAGLFDKKQGEISNFNFKSWLAVRDNNLDAIFTFKPNTTLGGLTISYGSQPGSHIMPPNWVEIYIKNDKGIFEMFKRITPEQPKKMKSGEVEGMDIKLGGIKANTIKIIVKPLPKLPNWHDKKGEKAWFFVDEVFFY